MLAQQSYVGDWSVCSIIDVDVVASSFLGPTLSLEEVSGMV